MATDHRLSHHGGAAVSVRDTAAGHRPSGTPAVIGPHEDGKVVERGEPKPLGARMLATFGRTARGHDDRSGGMRSGVGPKGEIAAVFRASLRSLYGETVGQRIDAASGGHKGHASGKSRFDPTIDGLRAVDRETARPAMAAAREELENRLRASRFSQRFCEAAVAGFFRTINIVPVSPTRIEPRDPGQIPSLAKEVIERTIKDFALQRAVTMLKDTAGLSRQQRVVALRDVSRRLTDMESIRGDGDDGVNAAMLDEMTRAAIDRVDQMSEADLYIEISRP